MSETFVTDPHAGNAGPPPGKPVAGRDPLQSDNHDEKPESNFTWFLIKLLIFIVILRSFVFAPFAIPSESMMPALLKGDYLIASKWPYGLSSYSVPFELPIIPGRILPNLPERGDVAIFKHPLDNSDYIKRVIGLPGDVIAMRNGVVILNGSFIPKERLPDLALPRDPNTSCRGALASATRRTGPGQTTCRYLRYRETLPSGKQYVVFDFGPAPRDNFGPVTVPDGHVFMLGDNRDNSEDSRYAARIGGGVGLIDADLLVARAEFVAFSTDGSADWMKPWTWATAARWSRIGGGL